MNDREAIFDYLEADSPRAAILIDDRIEAQVELLTDTPEIGRPGRIEGTRELVIQRTPYMRPTGLNARPSRSCGSCMVLKSGRTRWSPSERCKRTGSRGGGFKILNGLVWKLGPAFDHLQTGTEQPTRPSSSRK
jgi:hypothetical protein